MNNKLRKFDDRYLLTAVVIGTIFIIFFYVYVTFSSSSYENNKTAFLSNILVPTSMFVLLCSLFSIFKLPGWKRILSILCALICLIIAGLAAFAASFSQLGSY